MNLQEFISGFDFEGAIILLEGKRTVLAADQEKLYKLGRLLASETIYMRFRSGNAEGADQFFSEGVASVNKTRLEVISPYQNHRKKTNQAYNTIPLDAIDLASEPEVIYQSKQNKKTEKLIDQYVSGSRDRNAIKAAYIIRDTIKAIGTGDIKPATFGIFYDDLENPRKGGTGHTMSICEYNDISIINQEVWFKWLEK